tara:strand:+ start:2633 stop:3127 length:495 start_codon:yes stop_codon:yes gene_type:complete
MAVLFKHFRFRILELAPLILLLLISFSGLSVIDLKFFTVNVHYILIYFWVLRKPDILGNGSIFLSGIITDVVFGLPIGVTALALLIIAGVASYVRVVTVNISLVNDWISFIPALLLANLVYFITLYISNYSIEYLYLFQNSIFTFFAYPVLWAVFTMFLNFMRN